MREKDRAVIERLREIVEFVEGLGRGIAVIENGDCMSWEDAKRVRETTGAHSVMIARGAEANPSCFSSNPLKDIEKTLIPAYLRVGKYLDNHWGLTKFCVAQFKAPRIVYKKVDATALKQTLAQAKGYDDMSSFAGSWTGEKEMLEIIKEIEERPPRDHRMILATSLAHDHASNAAEIENDPYITPEGTQNPEPPGSRAPFLPANIGRNLPPMLSGQDPMTPTPGGGIMTTAI